jgi:hypothetical protein
MIIGMFQNRMANVETAVFILGSCLSQRRIPRHVRTLCPFSTPRCMWCHGRRFQLCFKHRQWIENMPFYFFFCVAVICSVCHHCVTRDPMQFSLLLFFNLKHDSWNSLGCAHLSQLRPVCCSVLWTDRGVTCLFSSNLGWITSKRFRNIFTNISYYLQHHTERL